MKQSLLKIGRLLSKVRVLSALRIRTTHDTILQVSVISLILLLALCVRLLPMKWGWHLSEFDPFMQYRLAKHMVDNGFFAWLNWLDLQRWYPYGAEVWWRNFFGLSLSAAFSYKIYEILAGPYAVSLYDYCILYPVILGVLTCLMIFFLAKDIGGKTVGIFASLFLALSSSHIARTSLGFFDDESLGIFLILLLSWSFLRSIDHERTINSTLKYSLLSGFVLGYLCASWGASLYPIAIIAISVLTLILLKKCTTRLLFSYSVTFGLGLFMAMNVPKLGYEFLFSGAVLPAFGVFGLLCLCEILSNVDSLKWKTIIVILALATMASAYYIMSEFGYVQPIGKFLYALSPEARMENPLFQSVAEHRVTAWGSFYYDFGIGAFFLPLGFFFAFRNLSPRNLFLIIYGLTGLYFASSMVRLSIILSPALCILWALAVYNILKPFVLIVQEKPSARQMKHGFVGREFSAAAILMIFLLLTLNFALPNPRFYQTAYSPVTIMSSSIPIKPDEPILEWYEVLMWMKENLPDDSVICSWWDYGYWITIIANKTTLADNQTINGTQIENIAKMFLSNETEAIKILQVYDVTHVVVFTTFRSDGAFWGYGEDGKWGWMVQIAGLNRTGYYSEADRTWTAVGRETVIYKLMQYGKEMRLQGFSMIELKHFEKAYFSQGKDYGGIIPLVCVYKVNYKEGGVS